MTGTRGEGWKGEHEWHEKSRAASCRPGAAGWDSAASSWPQGTPHHPPGPVKHHAGDLSPKYLCEHHQANQVGEDGDQQDEGLPAVLLAEDGGVHVHKSCHKTLHAHKLQKAEIPPLSAHLTSFPAPLAPPQLKPVLKRQWLLSGRESLCSRSFTWLSSPSKTTMRKKKQAQSGEKGSMTTARG